MPHDTLLKFNYPQTLLREYQHWAVLLRPKQVTVGSLVLICTEEATRVSDVSPGAFAELKAVTTDLETALQKAFAYEKINYVCLMMVDKQVHFHVIPRYSTTRGLSGKDFADPFWPGPPDVTKALEISDEQFTALLASLRSQWPR